MTPFPLKKSALSILERGQVKEVGMQAFGAMEINGMNVI
jgi:hypothetical protein